jgi:hypothetical protein
MRQDLSAHVDNALLSPKMRASYSTMLLVALKSRCTMYLNCSPLGVRSRTPAPAPSLHEEPSKKSVPCGSVNTKALTSSSLMSEPPGWHGGAV